MQCGASRSRGDFGGFSVDAEPLYTRHLTASGQVRHALDDFTFQPDMRSIARQRKEGPRTKGGRPDFQVDNYGDDFEELVKVFSSTWKKRRMRETVEK